MDVVLLARIQFALTVMFHFLFPPITIGLALLIAGLETAAWRTGSEALRRASDFWIRLLVLTFTVGVASGIVMEFEFGTNWAAYSRFVGDIFGAPLAAEGIFSFFLESTFIGLLVAGRRRIPPFLYWLSTVLVALGTVLSAFWILAANSWMQTPAGFRLASGRAELTDFWAATLNPSTLPRLAHTVVAALAMGSFLMAGIAAWWLLKGRRSDVATISLRVGVVVALVATVLSFVTGDRHAKQVARTQEAKFAAMEGLYETVNGAPLIVFSLPPRQSGPREGPAILVTQLTSALAFGNFEAPVKGLRAFPREDWPPVAITFLSFHNMVVVGNLMLLVSLVAVLLLRGGRLERFRPWLVVLLASIPLPMIAIQLGWLAAEVGRQPWIVYGLMRTQDGISRVVGTPALAFSLVLFSVVETALGALWLWLLVRQVRGGPEPVAAREVIRAA